LAKKSTKQKHVERTSITSMLIPMKFTETITKWKQHKTQKQKTKSQILIHLHALLGKTKRKKTQKWKTV